MLKKRLITAAWAVPLVVAAIWFDRPLPWFTLFISLWGLLAVYEFYRLVGVSKSISLTAFGLVWTFMFIVSPHFGQYFAVPFLLTSGIVLSLIMLLFRREKEGSFVLWAWTLAGILYLGWLLSYLVALRLDAGQMWVFLAIFITFGTDSFAFLAGRTYGRHKLAPRISPAKTWEGAVGGLAGAIIVSIVLVAIFRRPISFFDAAILGVVTSIFAQLGGLVMSLLKRNMGVKDSGSLIPGHGGILDRTDSVLFAGVVVFYYVLGTVI
ncbi:MAG: phosphatidate cytidylyltransferase [Dehalococcoidales bacterium]|nr:phosphatidate cytidylyltransferase [Dehalococcoidales bacterium]